MGMGYSYDRELLRNIENLTLRDILEVAERVSCEPVHEVVVKDEEVSD